jgi:WD40 repeat protein
MRSDRCRVVIILLLLSLGASRLPAQQGVLWMRLATVRAIYKVSFSADSRGLAVGAFDAVQTHDVADGAFRWRDTGVVANAPAAFAYSGDGSYIAYVVGGEMRMWDATSGSLDTTIGVYEPKKRSIEAISDNGVFVAREANLNDAIRSIAIHSLPRWDSIRVLHASHISPLSLAISSDGGRVAMGFTGGDVVMFDGHAGDSLYTIAAHPTAVAALIFSHDGRRFATYGTDRIVNVWDVSTGEQVAHLVGHLGPVTSADFSADGKYIVTASSDGTVRTWDIARSEMIHSYSYYLGNYQTVAYSPDMKYIAAGTYEGMLLLLDASFGKPSAVDRADAAADRITASAAPNPFGIATSIRFILPSASHVALDLFDLHGRRVATLADEMMDAGEHRVQWEAASFPPGVYTWRLVAGGSHVEGRVIKE